VRRRLPFGLLAGAVVAAVFAAPAWALAPSHANITFRVGSTVRQNTSAGEITASAILAWRPGAGDIGGVACCTNDISDADGFRFLGETTSNRFSFLWNAGRSLRLEVDSYDARGNYVGTAFTNAPTFVSLLGEDTDDDAAYRGAWSTQSTVQALDGSLHYSTARGASATWTASVRTIAWVTTVGPTHGLARVYVDGRLAATVSTHAAATGYRRIAFARAWWDGPNDRTHMIRIVNAGTPGHSRVDVDGFVNVGED
jgi:hypothetical protein